MKIDQEFRNTKFSIVTFISTYLHTININIKSSTNQNFFKLLDVVKMY